MEGFDSPGGCRETPCESVKVGEWESGLSPSHFLTLSLSFLSSPPPRSKVVRFGAEIGELNSPEIGVRDKGLEP